MKQRAFLVKYRPEQWGGCGPGQGGDLWALARVPRQ